SAGGDAERPRGQGGPQEGDGLQQEHGGWQEGVGHEEVARRRQGVRGRAEAVPRQHRGQEVSAKGQGQEALMRKAPRCCRESSVETARVWSAAFNAAFFARENRVAERVYVTTWGKEGSRTRRRLVDFTGGGTAVRPTSAQTAAGEIHQGAISASETAFLAKHDRPTAGAMLHRPWCFAPS